MPPRSSLRTAQRTPQREGFFRHLLDPIDRLAETIFSVLILLTFTLAYRIITFGIHPYEPITADYMVSMFVAALGATFAWGLIDGVVYVLLVVLERGEKHRFLANVHAATTQEEGIQAIADELDFVLEPIIIRWPCASPISSRLRCCSIRVISGESTAAQPRGRWGWSCSDWGRFWH